MAINYDTLNIRDKEDYKFRNTAVTDNKKVKVAVEVENDSSNPIPVYITDSTNDTKINHRRFLLCLLVIPFLLEKYFTLKKLSVEERI
jgi:hypothetical protein